MESGDDAPGHVCVVCGGIGYTPGPVAERSGYTSGDPSITETVVVHVTGSAGLGPYQQERWGLRYAAIEGDELQEMDDGALAELRKRLRRLIVMADDDRSDFALDWISRRAERVEREWSWRMRASDLGAERPDDTKRAAAWAERVDRIKRETNLALLIAYENDQARPVGSRGRWICCCPFHQDRHPSLDIDTQRGLWICRSCNVGGDAITYVEMRYGLGFATAVRHLEQRLGVPSDAQPTAVSP